ncbi:MAG: heavy-metal-associated domain-containing protein [Phycisphaerales bacterium]|nr:heavy-metal-associated domain-containing protein [Phycisphaerales bacterium]
MNSVLCRGLSAALSLSVVVLLASILGCSPSGGAAKNPSMEHAIVHKVSEADIAYAKSGSPVESDSAILWVNGLGCPLCATNIDHQLARVPGVGKVNVDLSAGKVDVGFKPGSSHPSPAQLGEAVDEAGFTLVKIEKR